MLVGANRYIADSMNQTVKDILGELAYNFLLVLKREATKNPESDVDVSAVLRGCCRSLESLTKLVSFRATR